MKEESKHFCYGDGRHADNCNYVCIPCQDRAAYLKQQEFNVRLSAKIKQVYSDPEFLSILADELRKSNGR
jgi:hypothetical protein